MKKLTFAQVRLILVICFLITYTLLEIYIFWNIRVEFENLFAEVSFYTLVFLNSIVMKAQLIFSCDYLAYKINKNWY